jgi:hypothetical protein
LTILGEHNIIYEQFATWEQASHPTPTSQLTLPMSTNKKAKKVHTPHDASLAPSGITEALEVSSALKREVGNGMQVPEKFFVSSSKRTGETCGLEWGWLFGSGITAETGKAGWVEGEDRGCGIAAIVIEVSPIPINHKVGDEQEELNDRISENQPQEANIIPARPNLIYAPSSPHSRFPMK